ncbi:MAG: DUF305 domain-containing protein [Chitinophagaceae bacterium]
MNYKKFLLMMIISFIIMYAVMFLNVARIEHVYLSTTRFYMALLMVAPMAMVMLLMMGKMYPNKKWNLAIIVTSIAVFVITLTFLRQQTFIEDRNYMKAMIPHHSSAILVSKNASLKDPEVKQLAEDIIKAQEKEIALMKSLLERSNK